MEYKEKALNNVIRHVFISRRQQRGLTQANLSLISNTTRQFISQIESGKRLPSIASISSFAAAVNMSLTELFQEVDRLYSLWENTDDANSTLVAEPLDGQQIYVKNALNSAKK